MPIVTTRFGTVIDAIVTLLKANPTFADPVRVYDGPENIQDDFPPHVFIGYTGEWENPVEDISITRGDYYIGPTTQTETLTVNCQALAWTGDNLPKTCRDAAIALLAGVDTVIRTDPSLGIDGSTLARAMTPGAVYQYPFGSGLACRILFSIVVDINLTTSP